MKKTILLLMLMSTLVFANAQKDSTAKKDTATENVLLAGDNYVYALAAQYVQTNFKDLTIRQVEDFLKKLQDYLEKAREYYLGELEKKKSKK